LLNHCVLIGRLATSPDLKYLNSGTAVCTFTLALDRQGTKEKTTDFLRIICWQKLAEIVANNLEKGRLVAIQGSIQSRKYTTQAGEKREAVEIVARDVKFLDYKKKEANENITSESIVADAERAFGGKQMDLEDEELPF